MLPIVMTRYMMDLTREQDIFMHTYLERYLEGDREGVWAELVGLGPAVRDAQVCADAQAVAVEMMHRARHNVEILIGRLKELRYRFANPEGPWTPPGPWIVKALDELEARFGPLPIVIRAWYERVGEVDFTGAYPRLSQFHGLDWDGSEELGCYSDPLTAGWLASLQRGLASFYINHGDWDEMERMERENPPPYGIDFGMSAINKANHSGAGSVQVMLPNPGFDAPLIDWDGDWMGTFFVPYLRTCFAWGGFPGFRNIPEGDRPLELLASLRADLQSL
jgi:hypothetical protein